MPDLWRGALHQHRCLSRNWRSRGLRKRAETVPAQEGQEKSLASPQRRGRLEVVDFLHRNLPITIRLQGPLRAFPGKRVRIGLRAVPAPLNLLADQLGGELGMIAERTREQHIALVGNQARLEDVPLFQARQVPSLGDAMVLTREQLPQPKSLPTGLSHFE